MRRNLINDPVRNPFHNRFHVPVHSRLDEMQAYTHMIWLNDPLELDHGNERAERHRGRALALAGAFVLVLVVVFSLTMLAG